MSIALTDDRKLEQNNMLKMEGRFKKDKIGCNEMSKSFNEIDHQEKLETFEIALQKTEKKSKETRLKKFEKNDIDRERGNLENLVEQVSKLKDGYINLLTSVDDPEPQMKAIIDEFKYRLEVVDTEITGNLAKVDNADTSLSSIERKTKFLARQIEVFEITYHDLVSVANGPKDDTLIDDIKLNQNNLLGLSGQLRSLDSFLNGDGFDNSVDCTEVNGNILQLRTRHHNLTSKFSKLADAIESGSHIPGNFKSGQKSDQAVKQEPVQSSLDKTLDKFIEHQLNKQMAADLNTGTGAGSGSNAKGKKQKVTIMKGSKNNCQDNNNNNNNNNINADERNNTVTNDSLFNGFHHRKGVTIIKDSHNASKNNFNNNNNDNIYSTKSGDNTTNDSDNDESDDGNDLMIVIGAINDETGNNNDNNNRNRYGAAAASAYNAMERNHAPNAGQTEEDVHQTFVKRPMTGSSDPTGPRGFADKAWSYTTQSTQPTNPRH